MDISSWKKEELRHLQNLWDLRPEGVKSHTKEIWNERAHDWVKDLEDNEQRRRRSQKRIEATALYLIRRGVLTKDSSVIDIGCGPGQFAAEFAKTAKHVTGMDISDQMVEYGREYCKSRGIENVSFLVANLDEMDPVKEGLYGEFDLVFASNSPPLGHKGGYEKAMEMTNSWFFNANFLETNDTLQSCLSERLDILPVRSRDGAGAYCMVNELMLKGYYPELMYYRENDACEFRIEEAISEYQKRFYPDTADEEQKEKMRTILSELADENGVVRTDKEWIYIWVLVDKKRRNFQ